MSRNWEISSVPRCQQHGGTRKAKRRNLVIYADEKSDTPIVPGKLANKERPVGRSAESVEERGVTKGNVSKPPTSRTQSREHDVSMGLDRIRRVARQDKNVRFTSLLHHITPDLLEQSFYALRRTAAVGVDGVTWRDYEKGLTQRLDVLHQQIHAGAYRCKPSRRVYIPKADGRQRPLGIASLEDKVVQQAVSTVLSAIYEEDFLGFSYGFRPGRGQHEALDALTVGIKSRYVNWILDADIQSFFDEIDHEWMLKFLGHRIADQRVLRLIRKWLKAGRIEDGCRIPASKGTPQGAVISPLLANIYLHYVLDLWARQWRARNANNGMIVVRYADDSVFGFQRERLAERFYAELQQRMNKFGLSLNASKTRLIEFGRGSASVKALVSQKRLTFLGFTHCCGTTRQGRFTVVRLTVKKRMRATLAVLREQLMRRRHQSIPAVGKWLQRVIRGYYAYYAVPTNVRRLDGFRAEACRAWLHALRRRSQRHRMPWKRFASIANQYIPRPRKLHPYPEERFHALHPR